jgi:hypothetical protein
MIDESTCLHCSKPKIEKGNLAAVSSRRPSLENFSVSPFCLRQDWDPALAVWGTVLAGAWAKTISHNSQQTFLPWQKFNRSETGFELSLPKKHPSQNKKILCRDPSRPRKFETGSRETGREAVPVSWPPSCGKFEKYVLGTIIHFPEPKHTSEKAVKRFKYFLNLLEPLREKNWCFLT